MKTPKESLDITKEKIAQLRQIFPEVIAEGKVDFNKLKLTLGADVEDKDEHYSFTWAGRKDAFRNIQTTAKGTLTPDKKESINFDSTENLFIEGDNLEALKLLQKAYFNKVKMIYIDPPYNTGNDFVYKDDFKNSIDAYLKQTGQANGDSTKLTTNPETSGRYHSDWITMMYPRLFLARNLLKEDGVIFISIDDNEVKNLRNIMDEIFGEENRLDRGMIIWNNAGSTKGFRYIAKNHEYIVAYSKNITVAKNNYGDNHEDCGIVEHYCFNAPSPKNPTSRVLFKKGTPIKGTTQAEFKDEVGGEVKLKIVSNNGRMKFSNGTLTEDAILEGSFPYVNQIKEYYENLDKGIPTLDSKGQEWKELYFNSSGLPRYLKEKNTSVFDSIIRDLPPFGAEDIKALFDGKKVMNFPKPVALISRLIDYFSTKDDIVLDFFAGSGTTAHAILENNASIPRKFILVQLPEQLDPEDQNQKPACDVLRSLHKPTNLAEISKERIRRVIKKLNDEVKQQKLESKDSLDLGFKVFKLSKSNYRIWENYDGKDELELKKQLQLFKDPLVKGYNDLDVIYECIIKEGLTLNAKIEELKVKQNKVYKVSEQEQNFCICLDAKVNSNALDELKLKKDDVFICLDDALDDSKKANLASQCKVKTL